MRIEGEIDLDLWGLGVAFGFDEDGVFFFVFQILPCVIYLYLDFTARSSEEG